MAERDRHTDGTNGAPLGAPGTVAGFRLLRKIGEGGMSAVYQSYDVATDRPVAVKLLADHLAGQPEFVGRFYREARLSRVLEHTNIVQGYASGFDADANKHYLVLEFIDGPTTHGALARLGRLPVGVVVRIGIDIATALEFLHDRQYVHRDVKPDNILLHPDGVAKLADLGLAKRLNDDSQLTSVHQGVGTSYYMPYEQAVNANLVDWRSDIFALGATLYHLLTGEVPFAGATHDEVVREKWQGSFRPVRELAPAVPEGLAELIEATLACDPRSRVQKAGQFAKALAATNLATRLPSFAHEPDSSAAYAPDPLHDSPTRADHRVPLVPPPDAPAPPVAPPGGEAFARSTRAGPALFLVPPFNLRRPGWLWLLGGAVLGSVLVASQFARPRPAPPSAPRVQPSVVRDLPRPGDGHAPEAPQ
jgi:serine/threonine protein kinase